MKISFCLLLFVLSNGLCPIDLGQVNVDVKPQAFLRRVPNSQHHENPAVNSDAYALDLSRDRSGAKSMWTVDERLRSDVRRPAGKRTQRCQRAYCTLRIH